MSDGETIWTYTYNADGLRTQRTNGTTTYKYYYNGSQLSRMTVGNTTFDFTYDASGTPLTVTRNGNIYYYVTNLQGDVTAILDEDGIIVATYVYDAWGNPLAITGSMATTLGQINPLRYRGYVYDQETGLYYLQSRYYNPATGRFLSADSFASTGQGILGHNMYAYCGNNPIVYADYGGNRYCAATSVSRENAADRSISCQWQRNLVFENSDNNNPANVPPDHPNFIPPKKGNRKVKNPGGKGRGWEDKSGNIWVWTPGMHGGEGWTINYPGGGHGHAYPGGRMRNHCTGYQNPAEALLLVFVGGVTTVGLIVDNITYFGIADDSLIAVTGGMFVAGITGLFKPIDCYEQEVVR